MRHMRSRRILAMLLALSMIFGLLTTTAFAGEVDQNTSNVGESAANGTSEGGSGEGQSSGASEDESSKVTNKEDVPTGEETIPEEKKTTSDEEVDTQEGVGEQAVVGGANSVASIGETGYESLDAAIQAAQDNDIIVVSAGEYTLNGSLTYMNKAFTIKAADGETVRFDMSAAVALHGAKITFEGVTFDYKTNGNYIGLQHTDTLVYNNCVINGMVFLYATNETFNNCTFNQTSADAYNVWTYGAKNVAFNSCTFNCVGKSVLVYNEGANAKTDLNVNDTTFNASAPVEGKAAIEIDTSLMTEGATITVDANTTADGFAEGSKSGNTLWNDKKQTADTNKNTTVTVAGETVFAPKSEGVATVGGVTYDTLEEAFAALDSANHTLTLLDDTKWDANTPVYWAAGTQSGYADTLAAALTAAYKAKADYITIICRPGADVGTMTHGHVADNITIYGNKAYISAGECDLEVDTFQFSRETGKQATDGVTLDKDITITAYELDNLGVWGQRNTNNTVNVNLTDCDTVQGITVQRVYISGTTGVNNITLSGCDFGTKATSVYSNADGDINIANCSFTDAQVPVNFNHKAGGAQTVTVSNCTFTRCGDDGVWKQFAAPVRFVNSGSGTQSATADTCTFAGTVGVNGDILIGDGRTGQKSNDVSLTVTNTEANIQAQQPGYYKDDGTTDNALKGEKALTAGETLTVSKMEDLIGGSTGIKGSSAENAYTLAELGAMTRAEYIAAQDALGGTMYVSVGDYSYDKDGVLGNGKRDDTTGQTEDRNVLNGYNSNGYLGTNNDGANGKNIVFVGSSITSGVTGYTSIDNIGTSLLLAVPAYTNVTFKGITFNNVMCFNYQLYTSPWSQLGELKFDNCTFNGIIVGATAAQTLTFNGCTFTNFTNTTDANSSNPTWIRPAYGNWIPSDNKGQGEDFRSLTKINFTNNKVTSTRPVKFEYISQWDVTSTITVDGNTFNISAQEGDTKVKNVGMYFGSHTNENAFNLILGTNEKIGTTAALYTLNENQTSLPVGSTVKDLSGNEITVTDALEWKTENPITLKTEPVPAVKNVAKVGETEYATLEEAIAKAEAGQTVTLIADVNTPERTYVVSKNLTIDLNGKTVTGSGYDGVFQIDGADAKVLIKNGNVVAVEQSGSAGKYAMAVWACAENCELTLEGLTVTQDIAHTDDKQMDMIYTSKGTIIINSGSFTSGTPAWTLNCKDAAFKDGSAKIIVNGGTFTGFDPCNNAAEGKGTSFVAEGVGVDYDENGSFTAKAGMAAQVLDADGNSVKAFATLDEAFNAAIEGQTVRLLKDLTEDVTIDKNITLDLGGKTLTNTGAGKATITIANGATATVKNGSVVGGAKYYNIAVGTAVNSTANLTLVDVTATAGNTGSSMVDNWGTLTIESGTYTGGLNVVKSEEGSKLTINGGKFTLDYATSGYTGVIYAYGDTTITGGEFIQSLTTTGRWNHPQVILTGVVEGYTAFTKVTGGTFTNNLSESTSNIFCGVGKATSDNFEVSGGTFNKSIPEGYCADGFIPTKNADGTYGVKVGKYVAKIGSTNYETLADAIRLAANSKTITLLADVKESVTIPSSKKNLTLDLNGFTLTNKDDHTIINNGTLTITDGSEAKTGKVDNVTNARAAIVNYGTMTLAGGTYTRSLENPENNKDSGGGNSFYTILNDKGGSLTIKDGVTVTNVGHFSSMICNGNKAVEDTTLTIEGGLFSGGINTIKNDEFGKLTINGGSFTNATQCVVMNWNEASITGGTFELASGVNSTLLFSVAWSDHAIGKMTISGGTFKYTETQGLIQDTYDSGKYTGTLAVSGGTFSSAVLPKYCAEGYIPADKGDGTYGVKEGTYVAEVNGKQYETLQAAIDAASKNQTVKLIADTTENVTMKTPYLTLDLNGHTLNGSTGERKPALTVTARVTVMDSSAEQTGTIKREDTAENSGVSSHYVIDVQGDGWLTFESGNVINNSGNDAGKGASLVRVGDDSVTKYPGLRINGGNFKQNKFIAIKVDRGDLFLNGGTITSENSYAIENWFRTTIKGGTVNGTVSSWVYSGGKAFSELEISGGTVNGDVASITYDKAEGKQARVSITGGTVTGTLGTYSYNNGLVPLQDPVKATIGVTGGTFSKDPTKYVVEGSSVTTNSDGTYGVEKAYLAKVGDTSYYTMEEAFKAQTTSGKAIVLLRDYTTGSSFNSGSINRTVDLNNHTWTYTGTDTNSAAFEVNHPNATLTVKNGTVVSSSMIGLIPTAMGGTIKYPNSGLVFENVVATANGHSGIETNGGNESVSVTLKDSTLNVPNGFGIYFPSSGKLTIDNSKITAMTLGVQVCSGSLDISGADTKIEVTGDPVPKTENDGAIQDGAAISIVNRTGYKGLDKITVTGGTFKAKSGNAAVKAYDWSNKEPGEATFTASDKVAISGGSYSTVVPADLCAEGFVPVTTPNTDGLYEVKAVEGDAELLDADGTSKGYGYADKLALTATEGQTIKLIKNTTNGGFMLPAGVTLDLNGKTMTSSFLFATGNVIDSTDGTGKLVVGQKNVLFQKNEKYLPLYDGTGYRFFQYQIVTGNLSKESATSVKARLQLKFTNADAYTLLINDSTGAHGMALNLIISWNAIRTQDQNWRIGMPNTVLSSTLNAMRNAGVDPSERFFTLTINGVNVLGSGETLYAKAGLTNRAWPGTSEAAYGSEVSIAID
ncbi:hypothetical protein [Oscillospiraceae bacterium]|nr:hypothetical protein [Oscillospiraceae bacterium]